jgi:hypothetical protein
MTIPMPSPITTLAQLTSQHAALYGTGGRRQRHRSRPAQSTTDRPTACIKALKQSRTITSLIDSATGVRIAPDASDPYAVAQAAERIAQANYMAAVEQALAAYHRYAHQVLPRYQQLMPLQDTPE